MIVYEKDGEGVTMGETYEKDGEGVTMGETSERGSSHPSKYCRGHN